jgi:predicted RNase H-like HicB family nuclease
MSKGVNQMDETNGVARSYLQAPYSRTLIPDAETGTYTAKIEEFPGCIAQGDTPEEAYHNLEAVAVSWIEELLGMGQQVPEPTANNQYSGRVALRLPRSLHRNAAQLAEREGTSLNQFLVSAIAEKVGAKNSVEQMLERMDQKTSEIATYAAGLVATMPGNLGRNVARSPWQRSDWLLNHLDYAPGYAVASPGEAANTVLSEEGRVFVWMPGGGSVLGTGIIAGWESEELSEAHG